MRGKMELRRMLQCEINFPRQFTSVKEEGSILYFYNEDIPTSYDCNHAIITDLSVDIGEAIADIEKFYSEMGITSRLYPAYMDGEYDVLEPYLRSRGFHCEKYKSWWATYIGRFPQITSPVEILDIKRVREVTGPLSRMMMREGRMTGL